MIITINFSTDFFGCVSASEIVCGKKYSIPVPIQSQLLNNKIRKKCCIYSDDHDIYFLFQLLSQVSLGQSGATSSLSQSSQHSSASASQTQAILNSIHQTLSAASGGHNGITVQPTTTRVISQNLNTSSSLNSSSLSSQVLGKISEIGASGHNTSAVNLANQILATRVSSTQLITANHVPSSLEGLMPSK